MDCFGISVNVGDILVEVCLGEDDLCGDKNYDGEKGRNWYV